jgi:hypothetical protein
MSATPAVIADSRPSSAMDRLRHFLAERERATEPLESLAAFERELRSKVAAVEQEAIARELARFDIDVPELEVGGVRHRRVLRAETSYLSSAGPVRVRRTLYRPRGGGPALAPLEVRAGIIEGFWTEQAAQLGAWAVAHLVPSEAEELFERIGSMQPSRASLDRLPKGLSHKWEAKRVAMCEAVRASECVQQDTTVVAVSLDGVQVPMKEGERAQKRERQVAEGKLQRGPSGYREAGCATLSFYDSKGEMQSTVRFARMPEAGKATLKAMLVEEVEAALADRPGLRIAKLADGAKDNWTFLSQVLPGGVEIVDFFHATEHLFEALSTAYGAKSTKTHAEFERLRHALRWYTHGVGHVIAELRRLERRYPRRTVIERERRYFEANRSRMRYAELAKAGLPIGSGIVEAACKTLVGERLKQSGMRWREAGGQAILTLRGLIQSDRFDAAWSLLAAEYKREVSLPENVIPISQRCSSV